MKKNLFIYESHYGVAEKTAKIFALVCGGGKACDIKDIKANVDDYDNVIFVVGFHGNDTAILIKDYILKNKEALINKKVAYAGIGISTHGSERYLEDIENVLGRPVDYKGFVHGEIRVEKLTEEDKKTLEKFLGTQNMNLIDLGVFKEREAADEGYKIALVINANDKILEKGKMKEEIVAFIKEHNTCALATGSNDYMRCTPIEYLYINDNFYFITEGGLKFRGIIENKRAAVSIFEEYSGFNNLKGLQAEGETEIIDRDSDEYKMVMKVKGINPKFLENSPINMNLVRLKVSKFEFLNSDFKKMGYDAKQVYEF